MTEEEFGELVSSVEWRKSDGYYNERGGYPVGPHEYIVHSRIGLTWRRIATEIETAPDRFQDVYPPRDQPARWHHRKTYLRRGSYVYWVMPGNHVLNREPVAITSLATLRAESDWRPPLI